MFSLNPALKFFNWNSPLLSPAASSKCRDKIPFSPLIIGNSASGENPKSGISSVWK